MAAVLGARHAADVSQLAITEKLIEELEHRAESGIGDSDSNKDDEDNEDNIKDAELEDEGSYVDFISPVYTLEG